MGISALMNGDKNHNTNLQPLTEIHNSSIRNSPRKRKAKGDVDLKLPQRGMGIEKLEEFRMNPQNSFANHSTSINTSDPIHFLHIGNPIPNLHVGSMELYPTYFNPRHFNSRHKRQMGLSRNQLRTDCFEAGPSSDSSTYCDTLLKKRRFNSENLDLRLNTADNQNIVNQYQKQHDVKIVALHEKRPSREEENVVIEYQFFPGSEMTYEQ